MLGINLTLNNVALAARTLTQKAVAILHSFGSDAHVYMPGVGWMNGLQAGNYLESTGQTPLTVDQPTGLLLDGLGSVIVPAIGDFGVVSGYTNTLSGVSSTGFATTATTTQGRVYINLATTIGTTYNIRGYMAVAGTSGVVLYGRNSINGSGLVLATSPSVSQATAFSLTFTADTVSSCLLFIGSAIGQSFAVSGIAITTGIQASQATTANKPILRRGAVNLLTYSGDFSNAAWGKYNATVSGSTLIESATTATHEITRASNVSIVAGTTYTYAVKCSPAGRTKLRIQFDVGAGTFPADAGAVLDLATGLVTSVGVNATCTIVTDVDGFLVISVVATAAATNSNRPVAYITLLNAVGSASYLGDGVSGINLYASALFKGTYTAAQIQALGGIPLTTTAPASTALGSYFWEFDGGNDSLALGSVPFQVQNDFAVIACSEITALNSPGIFSVSTGVNVVELITLAYSIGRAQIYVATGGALVAIIDPVPSSNARIVISGRKSGSSLVGRKNGVSFGSASTAALGSSSYSVATIGQYPPAAFFNGSIYPIIAIKGTVSDAQLLTLEKWVANASGVTI